jgi:predicted RNA methylase
VEPRGIADELALTAYLVAASRHPGAQVDPELLESLRSAIARVLTGADQTPTAPAT